MSRLAHHLIGPVDAPPVLMVHGFLSSRHQWDPNVAALSAAHRLVLVELPGHGDSDEPTSADDLSPDVVMAEIDRIRRALGIDSWWLIGQSLGAAVVLRSALTHPDHTRGVVFTNGRAAFGLPRGDGPGGSPIPADLTSVRDVGVHPIHARRLEPDIKATLVEMADRVTLETVGFVGANRHRWACADRLGDLTVPVRLVNGRWEKRFQPSVELARAALPQLELVDLEGGHAINLDQPAAFDLAVLDVLRRHERPAP